MGFAVSLLCSCMPFDFTHGVLKGNWVWRLVPGFLMTSVSEVKCSQMQFFFFSILIFVSEHFSVNTCFMRAGVVET